MNITFIDGLSFSVKNNNDELINSFYKHITLNRKNNVKIFKINKLNINDCSGCFSCLLKTPGLCIYKDDMTEILKEFVRTD